MLHKLITIFALVFVAGCATTVNHEVKVKAYTKRDGTQVRAHYRTPPDHTRVNNYSYAH